MLVTSVIFAFVLGLWPALAGEGGGLCRHWVLSGVVGALDPKLLPEESGLAVSRRFPGRLYHVNDSGGGPFFYLTNRSGGDTQKVRIEGYDDVGEDIEDLGIGPCGASSCLFVGVIGDNLTRRREISILLITEREVFGDSTPVERRIRVRYPDGAHNAEGLAVHPSGDIYILTKSRFAKVLGPSPARMYRLRRSVWEAESPAPLTLEYVGDLDLPALDRQFDDPERIVATALDIAPDGSRFLVLTYQHALEFGWDLSRDPWPSGALKLGQNYRLVPLRILNGQETAAYLPDGRSFLYGTELSGGHVSELLEVVCLDP